MIEFYEKSIFILFRKEKPVNIHDTRPIEVIDGKPVYGLIIKPEQYQEVLEAFKKEFGQNFIVAKKEQNGKLKVTFVFTSQEAPKIEALKKLTDSFQAQRVFAEGINPSEFSFSFGPPKHIKKTGNGNLADEPS